MLKSLARNISTNVEISTIIEDVRLETETAARATIDEYYDVLQRLMIVDLQPAFNLHIRSTAELRKTPKKHFADVSLAISLLNLDKDRLLNDPRYLGFVFESQAIHDLFVYSDYNDAKVYFHRDSNGNEVDAIVENRSGDWAAFEVKLSADYFDEAAKNLLALRDNINIAKTSLPKSLNIITGSGMTYARKDGVNVISLSSLGI
jgi:predicted AAA+ superfamily ATPase